MSRQNSQVDQILQTQITANAGASGTNAANIATNATDISTNVGNIATNATGVSTNAGAIAVIGLADNGDRTFTFTDGAILGTNFSAQQVLSLAGTNLSIADGNTVDLAPLIPAVTAKTTGLLTAESNAASVAVSTVGVQVAVPVGALSALSDADFDSPSAGQIRYLGATTAKFEVDFSACGFGDVSDRVVRLRVRKVAGADVAGTLVQLCNQTNLSFGESTGHGCGVVQLATNDVLEYYAEPAELGLAAYTVEHVSLKVVAV